MVEMIVATALFSVVMLVSVSTLLALIHANRKARAIESVMNNLNIALDGMVRSAREGTTFHGANGSGCGSTSTFTEPADCLSGGSMFAFSPRGSAITPPWIYSYNSVTKRLEKSTSGSVAGMVPITAPEVTIDSVQFFVVGSTPSDTLQPKVIVVVKGSAGAEGTSARTTFHIQATAVQRVLDL